MDLTNQKLENMLVSNRERKLIELLRNNKYAVIEVHTEGGQPVRVEKIKESIKL